VSLEPAIKDSITVMLATGWNVTQTEIYMNWIIAKRKFTNGDFDILLASKEKTVNLMDIYENQELYEAYSD
jgi:hypothetical protein